MAVEIVSNEGESLIERQLVLWSTGSNRGEGVGGCPFARVFSLQSLFPNCFEPINPSGWGGRTGGGWGPSGRRLISQKLKAPGSRSLRNSICSEKRDLIFLIRKFFSVAGVETDHSQEGRDSNPEPQVGGQGQEAAARNDVGLPPAAGFEPVLGSLPAGHGQLGLPRCRCRQFDVPVLRLELWPCFIDDVTVCRVRNGIPPPSPPPPRWTRGWTRRLALLVRVGGHPHVLDAELTSCRSNGLNVLKKIELSIFNKKKLLLFYFTFALEGWQDEALQHCGAR